MIDNLKNMMYIEYITKVFTTQLFIIGLYGPEIYLYGISHFFIFKYY